MQHDIFKSIGNKKMCIILYIMTKISIFILAHSYEIKLLFCIYD